MRLPPRNNIAAARRYYRRRGDLDPEDVEILLMLQDDSAALLEVMEAERWRVKPGSV
jgi:hypothetical protein